MVASSPLLPDTTRSPNSNNETFFVPTALTLTSKRICVNSCPVLADIPRILESLELSRLRPPGRHFFPPPGNLTAFPPRRCREAKSLHVCTGVHDFHIFDGSLDTGTSKMRSTRRVRLFLVYFQLVFRRRRRRVCTAPFPIETRCFLGRKTPR